MTFQAVPNGRKIELNGSQHDIPVVNVFYVTDTASATEARLTDIAEAVIDWFNAHASTFSNTYVLNNVTVTDVNVADSIQVIVSPSTGGLGTATGAPAAANAACCISLRTARIGRSYRGRMYIGAMANSFLSDEHTLSPTTVTGMADLANDLIDALAAIDTVLVVVSRFTAGVLRLVAVVTEIISIVVDAKVDSQRRRTAN